MKHTLKNLLILFLLGSSSLFPNEAPWYTGPLLAPAGITVPRGYSTLEPYIFDTNMLGRYNKTGRIVRTQSTYNYILNPIYTHGLADNHDFQISMPLIINRTSNHQYQHIGDVGVTLSYQFLRQEDSNVRPNLRISLQEIIPTGNFKNLDPVNNGADATGSGSYQTALSFNFQHLKHFKGVHYLRSRLSLTYVYGSPFKINGISSYGGASDTKGSIDPGNLTSADLAFEFHVTKHWVAVAESFVSNQSDVGFQGFSGTNLDGSIPSLTTPRAIQLTLAPAIEYNFNANVGIIGGYWFTIQGRNTADFKSTVFAINTVW